jgi:hypothetical protein
MPYPSVGPFILPTSASCRPQHPADPLHPADRCILPTLESPLPTGMAAADDGMD